MKDCCKLCHSVNAGINTCLGCVCHTPQGEAIKDNLRQMNYGPVYTPTHQNEAEWEKTFDHALAHIPEITRQDIKSFIRAEFVSKAHIAEVVEELKWSGHDDAKYSQAGWNTALSAVREELLGNEGKGVTN